MNAFYAFATENPYLTWFLAWGIWPVCWMLTSVLTAPFGFAFKAYNRTLRAKNIRAHGWPTAKLMDADGDIVHPPAASTANEGST